MKLSFLDMHQLVKPAIIINGLPMTGHVKVLDVRGWILSFHRYDATPQGLQACDDLRRSASNKMILATRHYGSKEILKVDRERAPNDSTNLLDVLPSEEVKTMQTNFKRVTGCNVQKLKKESRLFF
ncbi:unnamed protein product [Adineta ricciae]|uniref:Uncharacterized protein n=1 Tax=Adineta ricciae TaxID=249248 RepID=A0A813WQT7_ADIRI|nr:unnamed protein product [Adineta ricciae]CAF1187037.1 unnamed protein product [Adineta ricciae]